jgi:hypothetical protein
MQLNARIEVRLAEHENVSWGAAAEAGMTVSEWLRGLASARVAARPAPLAPDTAPVGQRPHYDRLCPICARQGAPTCPLCRFLNRVSG